MTQPLVTYTTYDGAEYTVLERPESSDGALVMQFRLPPGQESHLRMYTRTPSNSSRSSRESSRRYSERSGES
jgi:hypothetical protein